MLISWKLFNKEKKLNKILFYHKFCDNISRSYLETISQDQNNKFYLYSIGGNNYHDIAGVIIYRIILNTPKKYRIFISTIGIHPNVRNSGYGSIIIKEIIKKFNKNLEIVLLSLPSSEKFYEKLGFVKSDVRYILNNKNIGENIMMKLSVNISNVIS